MISKKIELHFPETLVDQPIVYKLVKEYNLEFNILKASVTPREEGLLIMELRGNNKDYDNGIKYLKEAGVKVQPLSQDIVRNDTRCTHCGVCIPFCPADALSMDPSTRKIDFKGDKCIACELCINVCPVRAMEVRF